MNREIILPRRRRRLRPYLDLTAMIDTVFNLLIFFAVTMSIAGSQHGIAMDLPHATTATPVIDRVVIALQLGQQPQVNGREVKLAEIGPALEEITHGVFETQIVVMAEKTVPYATLVAALDEVRLAGYHRIALATAPETHNSQTP